MTIGSRVSVGSRQCDGGSSRPAATRALLSSARARQCSPALFSKSWIFLMPFHTVMWPLLYSKFIVSAESSVQSG